MSVIEQNLGKVTVVHKGEYDAGTTYERLDIVSYNGSSYMAISDTTGNLPTDENYWYTVAEKGDTYEFSEEDWNTLESKLSDEATSTFLSNVSAKTDEFNSNAETLTENFNSNAETLTNNYNTNASEKLTAYNDNAETQLDAYNTNATTQLETYNTNATEKLTEYNTNATTQLETYNSNASAQLETYNTNATSKVSEYDSNATEQTTLYNTNASSLLEEYNTNATTKLSEYNTNATTQLETYNSNVSTQLETYNTNATEKINEYNENASSVIDGLSNREPLHSVYRYDIEEDLENGTSITVPATYVMDSNLTVFYCSERLIKDTHYTEVDENTISILFDIEYNADFNKFFDFLIKYEEVSE